MEYSDIVISLRVSPRDIHTVPAQAGRKPVWFYAFEQNGMIYVESGREHEPKSQIKGRFALPERQFSVMLSLYQRRKKGEAVSKEAAACSHCQVYWYGIFKELNF